MHRNLTLAYTQTDLTQDSTGPWAESNVSDRNITAVYMVTKMGKFAAYLHF